MVQGPRTIYEKTVTRQRSIRINISKEFAFEYVSSLLVVSKRQKVDFETEGLGSLAFAGKLTPFFIPPKAIQFAISRPRFQ